MGAGPLRGVKLGEQVISHATAIVLEYLPWVWWTFLDDRTLQCLDASEWSLGRNDGENAALGCSQEHRRRRRETQTFALSMNEACSKNKQCQTGMHLECNVVHDLRIEIRQTP